MKRLAVLFSLTLALAAGGPARAITFGQLDGNAHPSVGALVAPVGDDGALGAVCSGTLIAPMVFVTAAHCPVVLEQHGIGPTDVFVTFDPTFSPTGNLIAGRYVYDPRFAGGGQSNTYDLAVILLDSTPVGVNPARLPTPGLLDTLALRSQRFVAVGYGTVRDDKTKGFASLYWDPQRRWAEQGFRSLTKAWLNLSMNPSIGSGGTCYGDSGGPHFLGTTDIVVSITVTGDAPCRATDVTYRLDTPWAREFLGQFVPLPT